MITLKINSREFRNIKNRLNIVGEAVVELKSILIKTNLKLNKSEMILYKNLHDYITDEINRRVKGLDTELEVSLKSDIVRTLDLRGSFYDDEFRKVWENREKVSIKEYMKKIGVEYEELEVCSVGDCVIMYNCKIENSIPSFLKIVG